MQSESTGPASLSSPKSSSWRARLPFFYGWVVVASVFAVQAITYGAYYSFSVFYVALLEEFGWGRAETAGVFSVHLIVTGFTGIATGPLIDRFGPSRVVPAGGLLLGAGLAASSGLSELWQFYLYFGVLCGFGLALAGWVPCVAVVSRWFVNRRGTAIGIASAGIGLGIVAMVPISQYLMLEYGWRSAYLALAVLAIFGIAPQAALLQRGTPEELGMRPDGAPGDAVTGKSPRPGRRRMVVLDQQWVARSWTMSSAVRTARFWLMFANIFLSVLTNQMLWAHQAAYLVDAGYEKMLAASFVGLAGFISMPAKIMWGVLTDRFGREVAFSLGIATMLLAVATLVLVGMISSVWLALAFAVLFALGYAVGAPVAPAAAADLFAGRSFGAIFGAMNLGMGLGGAMGAWLAGFVFDATGSYLVAFGLAAACSAASALALWAAAPRKVRRVILRG